MPLLAVGATAGVWGYAADAGAAERHPSQPRVSVPATPYPVPAHPPVKETGADPAAGDAQPATASGAGSGVRGSGEVPVAPGIAEPTGQVISSLTFNGIPQAALRAYQRTQQLLSASDAGCHLPWQLVAAIGRVESNHGRFGGAVLTDSGRSVPGIRGPRLDGAGPFALVRDSDGGRLDGDSVYDRAVGPMQFLPSTWRMVGLDADGDGVADPQDIDDAAAATGRYLCAGATDLGTESGIRSAVYRYNHSDSYVALVFSIARAYAQGRWSAVPDGTPPPLRPGAPRFVSAGSGATAAPSGSTSAAEHRDAGAMRGRSGAGASQPADSASTGSRATTSDRTGGSSAQGKAEQGNSGQ
ncbi:MAG: lytic transglycosylase domain-containing protein, partial [Actinomycetales bacterium]